jgi:Sec-independent protein translocase protein TatA
MFGAGGAIKMIAALIIVLVVAGGFFYLSNLQASLAISQENSKKLADGIKTQQEAITKMQEDQQKIKDLNNELNTTIKLQNKDMENLKDRFSTNAAGDKRDFGKAAAAKPTSLERAINRGTANALRCLEIASGASLTEAELKATKPSEINRECPNIANPNYKPAGN